MAEAWWQGFFDADYLRLWGGVTPTERTEQEVEGIWALCRLQPGSRVLDAPCGYGRISLGLAQRGATVLGVDQSQVLLDHAESARAEVAPERLRYALHDLRRPLPVHESGYDAALNIFSSLGYGSDEDDLAILRTLAAALRPGGLCLVETIHRDPVAARFSRQSVPAHRLPDGTLIIEEPRFDPLRGRVETTWYWSGPGGSGEKRASLRIYALTELVHMMEAAGLRVLGAHKGATTAPFVAEGADLGGRVGLLAEKA
jgi:SAM-dependent methyltransferase